jgi:hypothetical protein
MLTVAHKSIILIVALLSVRMMGGVVLSVVMVNV